MGSKITEFSDDKGPTLRMNWCKFNHFFTQKKRSRGREDRFFGKKKIVSCNNLESPCRRVHTPTHLLC
jgi:hypothetical protein